MNPCPPDHSVDTDAWRAQLDADVDAQGYALRARLAAARQRALAALPERRGWRAPAAAHWRLAGAACALLLALAVPVSLQLSAPPPLPQPAMNAQVDFDADAELWTADAASLDLYEHLEFYAWLQSQPVGG